jgi:hypothetical protein
VDGVQGRTPAVYRYTEVAGQIASADNLGLFMPESFVGGFVLHELGSDITMSLETNTAALWRFTQDAKGSHLDVPSDLKNQRVDLVSYQDEKGSPEPSKKGMFALIEIKLLGGLSGADRGKLLSILKHIDTCRYGGVLSVLKPAQLEEEERRALAAGDRWYRCDVPDLPHDNQERFSVCVRAWEQPNRALT